MAGDSTINQGDQESIVYGVIRNIPSGDDAQAQRHLRANWKAIESLPVGDMADWPVLSRDMFAMPSKDIITGTFHTQVMHFAASYRAIEYEWERWLREFEALLERMYWLSATVHLETELAGKHAFHWHSSQTGHEPMSAPLNMRCQWEREFHGAI